MKESMDKMMADNQKLSENLAALGADNKKLAERVASLEGEQKTAYDENKVPALVT